MDLKLSTCIYLVLSSDKKGSGLTGECRQRLKHRAKMSSYIIYLID